MGSDKSFRQPGYSNTITVRKRDDNGEWVDAFELTATAEPTGDDVQGKGAGEVEMTTFELAEPLKVRAVRRVTLSTEAFDLFKRLASGATPWLNRGQDVVLDDWREVCDGEAARELDFALLAKFEDVEGDCNVATVRITYLGEQIAAEFIKAKPETNG